jgi:hypothetical protein
LFPGVRFTGHQISLKNTLLCAICTLGKFLSFLEAADVAFKTKKRPQDMFLLEVDNHAKAVVVTQEQINKLQT